MIEHLWVPVVLIAAWAFIMYLFWMSTEMRIEIRKKRRQMTRDFVAIRIIMEGKEDWK